MGRARSAAAAVGLAALLLVTPLTVSAAADTPKPEPICRITDDRIAELSGLVSDGERWFAVNDGGTRLEVFVLNRQCAVQRVITAKVDPYDVEDLALAADGTLWLADIGDNRKQRDTIALHRLTPDGRAVLHRLTYPDGPHDAETLLLDRTGTPYIVTKNAVGETGIYRPTGDLRSPGPAPLEQIGTVTVDASGTPGGPVGGAGSLLVTGGAVSPDGTVVALRTYTDAYLYPAPDGNIIDALYTDPVRIPLPNEQQGEAIALEPDGTLLSASEGTGQRMRGVRGAAGLVGFEPDTPAGKSTQAGPASRPDDASPARGGRAGGNGLPPLQGLLIAATVVGAAWFGLSRVRRR